MSGRGEVSSLPYPFAPPPRSSSSLQHRLAAGGLRRAVVSGPSLSIPFGGNDPHLVLLPLMPVLPLFSCSFCLGFQSSILGAVAVASLDFWPNLGLSRFEIASRQFGLVFGWSIFEFGRTLVSDLSTAVGNCCFPASSGTTALSRAVLPLGAVLPLKGHGTTAPLPVSVILLPLSDLFAHVLWLTLVLSGCLRVCVCGSR